MSDHFNLKKIKNNSLKYVICTHQLSFLLIGINIKPNLKNML